MNRESYLKKYRKKHRTELNSKANEKVICKDCNSMVSRSYLPNHRKSKIHIKNVQMDNKNKRKRVKFGGSHRHSLKNIDWRNELII